MIARQRSQKLHPRAIPCRQRECEKKMVCPSTSPEIVARDPCASSTCPKIIQWRSFIPDPGAFLTVASVLGLDMSELMHVPFQCALFVPYCPLALLDISATGLKPGIISSCLPSGRPGPLSSGRASMIWDIYYINLHCNLLHRGCGS